MTTKRNWIEFANNVFFTFKDKHPFVVEKFFIDNDFSPAETAEIIHALTFWNRGTPSFSPIHPESVLWTIARAVNCSVRLGDRLPDEHIDTK